jgi:Domain of unknown function (DUF4185)
MALLRLPGTRSRAIRICTMCAACGLSTGLAGASPDKISPGNNPEAIQPKIKEIRVELIGALTGPDARTQMKSVDICGTDLGTMTEIGNRIFFAFGDTFGYDDDHCRGVGGPNWRSNVFASTTDHDPADGILLQDWLRGADGKAIAIVEGAHQPPFTGEDGEQTKIPTAMVSVGNRIYLHYMSVHGFSTVGGVWDCNYSKFVFSDDLGKTWKETSLKFGEHDSNFNMMALSGEPGQGNEEGTYIYAMGTPCGRFGSVRTARVRKEDFLSIDAWEYFRGDYGWTTDATDAIEIVPAPVGEGSILWNPGIRRWMYTYLNEKTTSIELREAAFPWGPWSTPHAVAKAAQYPQIYGGFMTPSFLKDNGRTLYFIMSMFGSYSAFVMKAKLVMYE